MFLNAQRFDITTYVYQAAMSRSGVRVKGPEGEGGK